MIKFGGRPVRWKQTLAVKIGRAFGCDVGRFAYRLVFTGIKLREQLAGYAYESTANRIEVLANYEKEHGKLMRGDKQNFVFEIGAEIDRFENPAEYAETLNAIAIKNGDKPRYNADNVPETQKRKITVKSHRAAIDAA